jgi:hypothetical protein
MNVTTKPALAMRLRLLAEEMQSLGEDIAYFGGFSTFTAFGRWLVAGAKTCRDWAKDIDEHHK